ncbi:MAG: AAA family ATPase, partial [Anaerolineae bacterium]|nr:AAA family ATPase [Anaerolineae bacterium]
MYLKELSIEGYKNFGPTSTIRFGKGLNVLIGENGVGKSAIIDSIRLLLLEDEFGRSGISDTDFHRPFRAGASASDFIKIRATFGELSDEETIAFLPWTQLNTEASLTLQIDNKLNNKERYKRVIWGGESRSSIFDWEVL